MQSCRRYVVGMVVNSPINVRCCKAWRDGIPPTWLLFAAAIAVQVSVLPSAYCKYCAISDVSSLQIGFGLYPVLLKAFAANNNANPLIFSFYR